MNGGGTWRSNFFDSDLVRFYVFSAEFLMELFCEKMDFFCGFFMEIFDGNLVGKCSIESFDENAHGNVLGKFSLEIFDGLHRATFYR